jgi:hypothetical protein
MMFSLTTIFPLAMRRLDVGFQNPNKTAALVAAVLVLLWLIPLCKLPAFCEHCPKRREGLWWLALAGSLALGIALLFTGSRGGVVAAGAGLAAIFVFARPVSVASVCRPKLFGIAVVFLVWFLVALFLPQTERFSPTHTVGDASVWNRWLIWKNVPAMLAAAPDGWGIGNSGKVFMTWYQPAENFEVYRTLVNSHATWLVEFGWAGRLLYLAGWGFALSFAWPAGAGGSRLSPVPFAALVVFACASFFSSVAEEWVLWCPVVFALLCVVVLRLANKQWSPAKALFLRTIFLPALLVLFVGVCHVGNLVSIGAMDVGRVVRFHGGAGETTVLFGKDAKEDVRSLRAAWFSQKNPCSILWTGEAEKAVVAENGTFVLCGKWDAETMRTPAAKAGKIILFSPSFLPEELPPREGREVIVYFGEFFTLSNRALCAAWKAAAQCRIIPASADYIENWTELIFATETQLSLTRSADCQVCVAGQTWQSALQL